VLTAVTLVIAITTSFVSFFIGQYLPHSTHIAAKLSQPDVLRAVLGSALHAVLSGLLAFGIGATVRSTARAMTTAYGLLFLLPQLAKALPSSC
jgi:ABC-2 type transport system permease protein